MEVWLFIHFLFKYYQIEWEQDLLVWEEWQIVWITSFTEMEKRDDEQDEERAKELARKEAEEQLRKKQAEEEAEKEHELQQLKELKEKEERMAEEKARLEAEVKRLEEVRKSIHLMYIKPSTPKFKKVHSPNLFKGNVQVR